MVSINNPVPGVTGDLGVAPAGQDWATDLINNDNILNNAKVEIGADLGGTVTAPTVQKIQGVTVGAPSTSGTASALAIRDSAGRTQFQDPAAAQDAATKHYVDHHGTADWIRVDSYGADPTGVADSTSAIQAAIAAASPGQTIVFDTTGSGAGYKITSQITVTTASLRFLGNPRDAYTTSIRCTVASTTMFQIQATGVVFENIGLIGDATGGSPAGLNGQGGTVIGIEYLGDTDGNVDGALRGVTFQYLALGVLAHGRNLEISNMCVFSNCLAGIRHTGPTAYHTGPDGGQNRGYYIAGNRFHNIGTGNTTAGVEFTSTSLLLHAHIADNFFDSLGLGRHIMVTGTSANPAKGLTCVGNKHTEASAEAYYLTYCYYPTLTGFQILGNTAGPNWGHGIGIYNTYAAMIANFSIVQVGNDGINGQNNTSVQMSNGRIIQAGRSGTGNALNFDSTNSTVQLDNISGDTAPGYFFTGSPTAGRMTDCSYTSFTAGNINSNTLNNFSRGGLNSYVEGRLGKIQDEGYAQYDMAANTARTLATVTLGANYGGFILQIEATGRLSSTPPSYFQGQRVVYPENGSWTITTLGTDATAGMTVTIAGYSTTGVTVAITTTTATYIGLKVRAVAASAASSTGARTVSVAMAAQP